MPTKPATKPVAPWNKGRKLPPEVLTIDEVHALIKRCSRRAPTGIRNRALIVVLWRSGLRISEALALKPKDIDAEAGTIRVLKGKGDKARTVGIDPEALAVVSDWLERRKAIGITGRSPAFCTLDGGSVQPRYVRALLKRLGTKAGVEKAVRASHGLRHTHASHLREKQVDIGIISRQLGHSSIATTARYLDHLNPKAVIAAVRAVEWT